MKSILPIMLILLSMMAGCEGCFGPTPGPTGVWIGAGGDADEHDALILRADGSFVMKNQRSDIANPPGNGIGIPMEQPVPGTLRWRMDEQGTWEIDSTKSPWWLDLLAQKNGATRRVECLARMAGPGLLHLGINHMGGSGRPANFEQATLSIWRRPTLEERTAIESEN